MRGNVWIDRPVLVTGHTGFKGSWLSFLLKALGAKVSGYSLAPSSRPNLFELTGLENEINNHFIGDVRELGDLKKAIDCSQPEVIFHLAAQPLVRESYRYPLTTWSTNVMGTVNLIEAARNSSTVKAIVVVTTDKCYENKEWAWGYRENDPLGGHDPYSASKACAEIVADSYRRSFLASSNILIATARAGNVIGGGDWSLDRLIPDLVRAFSSSEKLIIRNPQATRPWQHVLDALGGYIILAEKLLSKDISSAKAFNFGPEKSDNRSVEELLKEIQLIWPTLSWDYDDNAEALHEATYLYLDSSLAISELSWKPAWHFVEAVKRTTEWYQSYFDDPTSAIKITRKQITAILEHYYG